MIILSVFYLVLLIVSVRYFYWRGWVHAHNVSSMPHGVGAYDYDGGYGIAEFYQRDDAVEYKAFLEEKHPLNVGVYSLTGKGTVNDGSTRFSTRLLNYLVSR